MSREEIIATLQALDAPIYWLPQDGPLATILHAPQVEPPPGWGTWPIVAVREVGGQAAHDHPECWAYEEWRISPDGTMVARTCDEQQPTDWTEVGGVHPAYHHNAHTAYVVRRDQ